MRLFRLSLAVAIAATVGWFAATSSRADLNYTQGGGTVIFDFVCFSTKHCPAHTSVNSAGTEIFTTANPGQVGVSGQINVTPSNCSGTISTGGSAQNVFSASATRRGFFIVNNSADPLWISFTTTAAIGGAASYILNPGSSSSGGGSFLAPLGFGQNTALSIIGATATDAYSCTAW